jgi:hypothetical protein
MFSVERVSYAERNFKVVIFKRVLRLNMNEINRQRLSFWLEAIAVLRDKSYKISWCNCVSLSCLLRPDVSGNVRHCPHPTHTS